MEGGDGLATTGWGLGQWRRVDSVYVCIGKGQARVRMRGLLGRGSAKVSLRSDGGGGGGGDGGGGRGGSGGLERRVKAKQLLLRGKLTPAAKPCVTMGDVYLKTAVNKHHGTTTH